MILMTMVWHSQSSPKSKFVMSLQYLRKEVRGEVDFFHADKHQSFLQVDFNILCIKVFYKVVLSLLMGRIKHSPSTQSKVLLGMEFIFCMQKNTKVFTSWHYFLDVSGQTCSKYLKQKIGNIFAIRRKNIATAFVFYSDAKLLHG